jgi:malonate-semialdehyde dehydrogenase (acetylating)/methylmalonate-semialdehyde dehydrogenase
LPSLVEAARAIKVGPTDVEAQPDMGRSSPRNIAIASRAWSRAAKRKARRSSAMAAAPASPMRLTDFYMGATIVDQVQNEMTLAREEVFGPVLNVMRMDDLDHAIELANKSAYGNGAAIFTNSGKAAREFKHRVKAGMVGINVGVPATMAMFPFTGWDESFYGDLHIQGKEGVQFYTQQKVVTTRWFGEGVGDVWKK